MKILEIVALPTVVDGNHESVYRSYHILSKVKSYLSEGVPYNIIAELIEEMENEKWLSAKLLDLEINSIIY